MLGWRESMVTCYAEVTGGAGCEDREDYFVLV